MSQSIGLVFEDLAEGAVHLDAAVVLNETHPAELVHKEIDALSRGAGHFGQVILADPA